MGFLNQKFYRTSEQIAVEDALAEEARAEREALAELRRRKPWRWLADDSINERIASPNEAQENQY